MYSIEELSSRFQSHDANHQEQIFKEITNNVHIYGQIAGHLPLIKYIMGGEAIVPIDQHGPIINAYKIWREKQQ